MTYLCQTLDWQLHHFLPLSPFLPGASWSQYISPSSGYYHIHIKGRRRKTSHLPYQERKDFPADFVLVYFLLYLVGQNCVTWPPLALRECRKPNYLVSWSPLNGKRQGKGKRLRNEILGNQQCVLQEWNSSSHRETRRIGLLSWPPPTLSAYILVTSNLFF